MDITTVLDSYDKLKDDNNELIQKMLEVESKLKRMQEEKEHLESVLE